MFQKRQKANLEGQSASGIILQHAIYNYFQNQQFADVFEIGALKVCNIHS